MTIHTVHIPGSPSQPRGRGLLKECKCHGTISEHLHSVLIWFPQRYKKEHVKISCNKNIHKYIIEWLIPWLFFYKWCDLITAGLRYPYNDAYTFAPLLDLTMLLLNHKNWVKFYIFTYIRISNNFVHAHRGDKFCIWDSLRSEESDLVEEFVFSKREPFLNIQ